MTDKEFLDKYDNGEKFNEEELENLLYDFHCVHEDRSAEVYKCHQFVTSIIKVDDRFFALCWNEDHGEYQEHEFYEQPHEVRKEKKIIETIEWVKVDGKEKEA